MCPLIPQQIGMALVFASGVVSAPAPGGGWEDKKTGIDSGRAHLTPPVAVLVVARVRVGSGGEQD